jgi:hypothetical protein
MLVCDQSGAIRRVFPHSGHYRPGDEHVQYLLKFLAAKGVDLAALEVDGQHTMKVRGRVHGAHHERTSEPAPPTPLNPGRLQPLVAR